jgi:hypothetical protein
VSLILPFDADAATAQKWKSPKFALGYRARRARKFASLGVRNLGQETIADPEEFSSFERWRQNRLRDYLSSHKPVTRDPRDELPILPEDTASTLSKRYGTSPERLDQALSLHSHGLHGKARRLVLCGRLGHRINHQKSRGACHRKFFEPYLCREKYCTFCGPQQFRELFLKLQNALSPIVEKLLCEGARSGREIVIAKLDFTIRNDGHMPTSEEVRKFHDDMRRFWRVVERVFVIKRSEYGVVRCDEIGGNNTNLHGHCGYVGPKLPQERKELSALWSIVLLPKVKSRRRRQLMRFARKYGLGELWDQLTPEEQRFVSIKRAKSFAGALGHALKYPAKFLDKSTPQRLAALEATFHKTRRVSTGGAFYRVKEVHEPGEDRELEHGFCPFCKIRLVVVHEQWQPLSALEEEGRMSLRTAEREAGLRSALGSKSPP